MTNKNDFNLGKISPEIIGLAVTSVSGVLRSNPFGCGNVLFFKDSKYSQLNNIQLRTFYIFKYLVRNPRYATVL